MKVLFIGNGVFGSYVLRALAETRHEVAGVVEVSHSKSSKGLVRRFVNCYPWFSRLYCLSKSKIKKKALYDTVIKYGLHLVKFERLNDEKFLSWLKRKSPDVILVAACPVIFKKDILNIPKLGCINCHPSLLPKYRGPDPFKAVILFGEKETGITYHYMNEGIDTGPIIRQAKIAIQDDDTAGDLLEKCESVIENNLASILDDIEEGKVKAFQQSHFSSSYFKIVPEEHVMINWRKKGADIDKQVRAIAPLMKSYTFFNGSKLYFDEVSVCKKDNDYSLSPGSLISISPDGLLVECADSAIQVKAYFLEKRSQKKTLKLLKKELAKKDKVVFS
jgi:methionyl-tRNA formyltransferase